MGFFSEMLPSSIRGGLLVLLLVATCAYAQEAEADEETAVDSGIPEGVNCGDGLLIPIWRPFDNLSGK